MRGDWRTRVEETRYPVPDSWHLLQSAWIRLVVGGGATPAWQLLADVSLLLLGVSSLLHG